MKSFYSQFKILSLTFVGLFLLSLKISPAFVHADTTIPRQSQWTDRGIILRAGPPGSWDSRLHGMISPCTVIKKNGIYFLYYIGADGDRSTDGGPRHRALDVATSTDGIHFTKHSGNPIITHLPHRNEEEGIFSAAGALDENGNVVLYYSALDAGSKTSQQVDSDVRLAISNNGFDFKDLGDVLSHADSSVWGYGDELFPVGALRNDGNWYVYYIAKGRGAFWDLGLAWGPERSYLFNSRGVLSSGRHIIGGCDPIRLGPHKIAFFILRDFKKKIVEVRLAFSKFPGVLSAPLKYYDFRLYGHFTIYLDMELSTWFLYYLARDGNSIRVMTASRPVQR